MLATGICIYWAQGLEEAAWIQILNSNPATYYLGDIE